MTQAGTPGRELGGAPGPPSPSTCIFPTLLRPSLPLHTRAQACGTKRATPPASRSSASSWARPSTAQRHSLLGPLGSQKRGSKAITRQRQTATTPKNSSGDPQRTRRTRSCSGKEPTRRPARHARQQCTGGTAAPVPSSPVRHGPCLTLPPPAAATAKLTTSPHLHRPLPRPPRPIQKNANQNQKAPIGAQLYTQRPRRGMYTSRQGLPLPVLTGLAQGPQHRRPQPRGTEWYRWVLLVSRHVKGEGLELVAVTAVELVPARRGKGERTGGIR